MKIAKRLLTFAVAAALIVGCHSGCTTTQTTAPDGTVTKVTRFDTQDAAEALALANAALANPLVSNALFNAISPNK